MTNRFSKIFSTVMISLSVAFFAQAELSKDVQDILEKSIEATGGREKLEKIKSSRMLAEFTMSGMGVSGTSEIVHAYPNKIYIIQRIEGLGEIIQAFDGEKGWAQDPMQGFRMLSDVEVAALKQNESITEALNYDDTYEGGEVLGEESVDGVAVWKVKLVDANTQNEETHYYAKESGRLLKVELEVDMGPMGKVPAVMKISKYSEQDGIAYPSEMEMSNAGMVINLTFNELELNPVVEDSLFAAPQ